MLKKIILWIIVGLISAQIFSFSAANSDISGNTSKRITKIVYETASRVINIEEGKEELFFHKCDKFVRKTAHFMEYFVLAIAVFELAMSYNIRIKFSVLIALLYCLLYAVGDEFHQLFVDGRSGNVKDVLIDFLGAVAGILTNIGIRKLGVFYRKR